MFNDRIVYFRSRITGGLVSLLESEVSSSSSLEEEIESLQSEGDLMAVGPPTPLFSAGNKVRARCFRAGFWPALPVDYLTIDDEILCSYPSPDPDAPSPYTLDGYGTASFASTDVLIMGFSYYLVEGCLVHSAWVKVLAIYTGDGLVVQPHPVWQLPDGWQSPCYLRQNNTRNRNLRDNLYAYSTDVIEFFDLELEPRTLYLGLEWEANLRSGTDIPALIDWFDQLLKDREAVPTRDGTVDLELKVSPMTPSNLKSFIGNCQKWFRSFQYGKDVGAHMHVSKEAFVSELAQAYFVCEVTSDAERDAESLFGEKSHFAKVTQKTLDDWKSRTRKEAVNTHPKETIEIRAFRGTGDTSILHARVDYVVKKLNEANRFALMR